MIILFVNCFLEHLLIRFHLEKVYYNKTCEAKLKIPNVKPFNRLCRQTSPKFISMHDKVLVKTASASDMSSFLSW